MLTGVHLLLWTSSPSHHLFSQVTANYGEVIACRIFLGLPEVCRRIAFLFKSDDLVRLRFILEVCKNVVLYSKSQTAITPAMYLLSCWYTKEASPKSRWHLDFIC